MPIENDDTIRKILQDTKTIAVVGASPKPGRDSGTVAQFLIKKGYTVIPVNPLYKEVLGLTCYPDLRSIPQKVDLVDIFRRSEEVLPIVEEAIGIGANTVWMQLGVVNPEAAARVEQAGLQIVMDRCISIEYRHLVG